MPELDVQQDAITSPTFGSVGMSMVAPSHPSPAISLLRLERFSMKEIGWWGHRFGIDTPYLMAPLGWGETAPLYGWDALEGLPASDLLIGPESPLAQEPPVG